MAIKRYIAFPNVQVLLKFQYRISLCPLQDTCWGNCTPLLRYCRCLLQPKNILVIVSVFSLVFRTSPAIIIIDVRIKSTPPCTSRQYQKGKKERQWYSREKSCYLSWSLGSIMSFTLFHAKSHDILFQITWNGRKVHRKYLRTNFGQTRFYGFCICWCTYGFKNV